ncbi:MAG TPA: toxin-antitoxin system protein [Thermoanaerobaculia bacterium]|nr:toxin-antitoxin system protein [Thermoanaerobaculia bacterium]
MTTVTVRILESTHRCLREIAASTGRTMPEIVEEAVESLRRQRFLLGLADDFAALRTRPEEWKEELAERAAWDATVGDDLQED